MYQHVPLWVTAEAYAPATVANVAVGFDVLGFAVGGIGDRVAITWEEAGAGPFAVEITEITGSADISRDPDKNTASVAVLAMAKKLHLRGTCRVAIRKGIPLASGLGGSAASAVAAVVALNDLLKVPLQKNDLISFALDGEAAASGGRHADNVAPALMGGFGAVVRTEPFVWAPIPVPRGISCLLIHPHLQILTSQARAILRKDISLHEHVRQSANLAGFVVASFLGNMELLRAAFEDVVIEPQRSGLIPGFGEVKEAIVAAGALGCTISGAGPTLFAWLPPEASGEYVTSQATSVFAKYGVSCDAMTLGIDPAGSRIVSKHSGSEV